MCQERPKLVNKNMFAEQLGSLECVLPVVPLTLEFRRRGLVFRLGFEKL
jgi:hypothetical protein